MGYVYHKGIMKVEASQLNFPEERELYIRKVIHIIYRRT